VAMEDPCPCEGDKRGRRARQYMQSPRDGACVGPKVSCTWALDGAGVRENMLRVSKI
jgi:hypothetical protein